MALAAFDTGTGKLIQERAITVSDVAGNSVTLATTAGNALSVEATAPAATVGASQAGKAAALTASDAVASTDTAGAAAGGSVTITAGAAARNTSGNANGGDIHLVAGAGIGTGTAGQVFHPVGTVAAPGIAFAGDVNTGFYQISPDRIGLSINGTLRADIGTSLLLAGFGDVYANTGATNMIGFKRNSRAKTTDATEAVADYQCVIHNEGATALVTRTLPTAVAGANYTYACVDADGIKIVAGAGDEIRVIDKVTAAAGYIQSTTIGSVVKLYAVNATTWLALAIHGVWTDGTFTYDDTSLTTP
jgi:hypothetical protein